MISPTIGRRVWFWPSQQDLGKTDAKPISLMQRFTDQPFDAGVCCVWNDRMVNLTVADHGGEMHERRSVTLVQEGDPIPQGQSYATWMPYQQGQAKKEAA